MNSKILSQDINFLYIGKEKFLLLVFSICCFISIYRNSWLPGAELAVVSANYILSLLFLVTFLIFFNINNILKFKIESLTNHKLLFLLLCSGVLSIFVNFYNEFTGPFNISRFFVFVSFIYFFFLILPKLVYRNQKYFDFIIDFYFWVGTALCLIGLVFYVVGFVPYEKYVRISRYLSLIIHPNYIAFFISAIIIFSFYKLYLSFKGIKPANNIVLIISIFIQFTSLLLTYSRGGIIGVVVGIFAFLFFVYRIKLFILLPFLLAIGIYFVMDIFIAKGTGSTIARLLLIIPVYYMFTNFDINTLFGFGISNAFEVYNDYRVMYGVWEEVNNPHNFILSMFIMFGALFTLIFLITFFYYMLKGSIKCLKHKNLNLKFIFVLSLLTNLFVTGLFDSALLMPEFFTFSIFLLFFGLLIIYCDNNLKT